MIFTASGFAGLIYESIWSHYLKLFLGHAAYAQTLVLAIFMGGMAIGAWAASRFSSRMRDLLVAYAGVEILIGAASLVFHGVFVTLTDLAFDRVIPALGSPGAVQVFKWSLGALLILPQSVLLGATFPLLTGGVLRVRPERSGYVVAMLYFTNSLGAAGGVLASGFYFIAAAGLPGTLAAAAAVNFTVAVAVILVRPRGAEAMPAVATAGAAPAPGPIPRLRLLLAIAALTGASSFMYEIGWIRMLSLVLGSSTHSFELMLSAFILGIAFGSLAIRRRIDAGNDPLRLLGWVQVAMGIAALATLPVYRSTFLVMQSALQALAPTETGYLAFHLVSHAICLLVMFPAAFCAGMTLPLITASLLRAGAGERAVGQVYAANTAGSILGVFVAVHVGIVLLGLKGLIVAGAAIDLALGVLLLANSGGGRRPAYVAAALAALGVTVAIAGVQLDAHRMASGVFRTGVLIREDYAVEQFDGKTATISLTSSEGVLALRTNGKSEGGIRLGPGAPFGDEIMMTLLGALPQFFAPQARQAANIGFGTGLSAHVLLASPNIEVLDTIEIEPAVVAAAGRFRPRNARALEDPRSRVHFDDAKTYFSAQGKRYDVIISEPSNPWVSGVSGLFSVEFYRNTRRYLRDDGLLFQWVHIYEMTPPLIATIIGALAQNFDDFEIWLASHGDMIVVAIPKGRLPRLDAGAFANPALRAELERFNIRNVDDLLLHRVAGQAALAPYYASFGVPANSDFRPVLDLNAAFARFTRQQVDDMPRLTEAPIPVLAMFDRPRGPRADPARFSPGTRPGLRRAELAVQAQSVEAYIRTGRPDALERLPAALASDLMLLRAALLDCRIEVPPATLRRGLVGLAGAVDPYLARANRQALWKRLSDSPCASARAVRSSLSLHRAIAAEQGAAMAAAANRLLQEELDPELAPYVAAARMAGLLLDKDRKGAMQAFQENRSKVGAGQEWDPVFRLLFGQAAGG